MIHLQIGEPDFDTPPHIVEAAVAGAPRRRTPTTARRPASRSCARRRPATCRARARSRSTPAACWSTPGAKPFLFFGVLATCNPGDEVIYPNPGFPIYESVIRWAGATPVPLPLTEEPASRSPPTDLAERLTPRTKLVILNSPANPTGGVVPREVNVEVARLLHDHDCYILSDEVYSEMVYDGEHDSIASHGDLLDRTILLDGFSKTFAMTGWRLGYAAVPKELVEPLTRLFINCHSCTPPAVRSWPAWPR